MSLVVLLLDPINDKSLSLFASTYQSQLMSFIFFNLFELDFLLLVNECLLTDR